VAIITAPPTLSPGKLALVYNYLSITHQASVNFVNGVDLDDIASIQTDAETLATYTGEVLPAPARITGYKVLSPTGQVLYRGSFSGPVLGSHGSDPGFPAFYSPTLKIMGRGAPTTLLTGSGHCSYLLFTRNAYPFVVGEKELPVFDTPLAALMTQLNTNLRVWADFYGQHADTTGEVFTQFHAHEQKRNGS
jgi:hypothetical protein